MLDFFERAYFAELDRKTKLHTALALPFSVIVVGITLLAFFVQTWDFPSEYLVVLFAILTVNVAPLTCYIVEVKKFLIGKEYQYIWYLDTMLEHLGSLESFSAAYPLAPSADETFKEQLLNDLARCTSHNAAMNDLRSENLYACNVSAMLFVLFALITASTSSLIQVSDTIHGRQTQPSSSSSSSAAAATTDANGEGRSERYSS